MERMIRAHTLPPQQGFGELSDLKPSITSSTVNYLTLCSRRSAKCNEQFDSDGPGVLSPEGPRHDNDFVNIRDIHILPTTDEILCLRPPFMPFKCFDQPHFLELGPERLIDTLFRQLRHDSVEILKDCTYEAAQKLVATDIPPMDYNPVQETSLGYRHRLYWDVAFEELLFDKYNGLMIRVSYSCPKGLRGSKMHGSGRFEPGMLVALVGVDNSNVGVSVTFFESYLCESTDSMNPRGGQGKRGMSNQIIFG